MNPDAKAGSGKNSRRRTPSVDTTVGGPGSNGGSGGVGGRGPDFKRRGRTKKNNMGVGGLMSGHMRYCHYQTFGFITVFVVAIRSDSLR